MPDLDRTDVGNGVEWARPENAGVEAEVTHAARVGLANCFHGQQKNAQGGNGEDKTTHHGRRDWRKERRDKKLIPLLYFCDNMEQS